MKGVRKDPERREIQILSRYVPLADAQVLEIGCGGGRLTRKMAGIAASIVGIDTTWPDVSKALQRLPKRHRDDVRYSAGSAIHLPFFDQTFDVVVLSWSL